MIRSFSIVLAAAALAACAEGPSRSAEAPIAAARPSPTTTTAAIAPPPASPPPPATVALGSDGLPVGPAHDTFVQVCSACHAPDLVADKRLDYAGWDELVQNMIGRGASASPEEARAITAYLAAAYPAPRQGG